MKARVKARREAVLGRGNGGAKSTGKSLSKNRSTAELNMFFNLVQDAIPKVSLSPLFINPPNNPMS